MKQIQKRAVLIALALAAGCQFGLDMWVLPGSTANNLTFGIADGGPSGTAVRLHSIDVYRCADIYDRGTGYYPCPNDAVWSAQAVPLNGAHRTNAITYGDAGTDVVNTRGPKPLDKPGCYVAIAYARDDHDVLRVATIGFHVLEDASVTQMERSEYERVFSQRKPVG